MGIVKSTSTYGRRPWWAYGDSEGYAALREAIAERMVARGAKGFAACVRSPYRSTTKACASAGSSRTAVKRMEIAQGIARIGEAITSRMRA